MPDNPKRRLVVALVVAFVIIPLAACTTPEPVVQQVEVTRLVPQTLQVEVTREVTVVREIPVTLEKIETVAASADLPTAVPIEVTREVAVTRIVVATPTPTVNSVPAMPDTVTPVPDSILPSPTVAHEAATPSPAPTLTALPATDARFDSWEMDQNQQQYGDRTISYFRTTAVAHETSTDPPLLTYQCDTRGGRAIYIDWGQPISTDASSVLRYSDNPFEQYRDDDLDTMAGLADQMVTLINDLVLYGEGDHAKDEMWKQLDQRWGLTPELSRDLIDRIRKRNHQMVLIELNFYS